LFSGNAKSQKGKAVRDILRMYAIKDFQCEPHHQHQNFAERCIQEVKNLSIIFLDRTGSSPSLWLLYVQYVLNLVNPLSTESLQWKTPIDAATGQRPDTSAHKAFHWYEPVYFKHYKSTSANPSFPSESQERLGRIVGIAEHKGDSLTFLVLDSVRTQDIARSELCSGLDSTTHNLQTLLAPDGSTPASRKTIKSHTESMEMDIHPSSLKLPRFSPDELLGKTFVRTLDDGKPYHTTIVRKIQDLDAENHANIKFLVELGVRAFDEIMAYGTLCECIEDLEDDDLTTEQKVWTFADVIGHQGPLRKSHNDWKGSLYNVLMLLEDDPITLASYAFKHDLLGLPGWKKLNAITTRLHCEQRDLGDFFY
jgi:hypothetical protein